MISLNTGNVYRFCYFLLYFAFFSSLILHGEPPTQEDWNKVFPYLLPDYHPAKLTLDKIFSSERVLLNLKTMKKAGFIKPLPRKFTRLIVTKHPELPGYVIKAYVDAQRYAKGIPEHYRWLSRIEGAAAIRKKIRLHQLDWFFKVPQKWIYAVPTEPSAPPEYVQKNFILIEEDMDLLSDAENEKIWGSERITTAFLDDLFLILQDLGLHDCAKPQNIPFSKDGKVAFIDTESHHNWPVLWKKLSPYLSPSMKQYWKQLNTKIH